jgi:hypothetical protein
MDVFSASVYELRGELRKLKRTFEPTAIVAMKRGELIHHIEIYRKMIEELQIVPKVILHGSGRLPARPIPTEDEDVDGTIISVPLAPPKRITHK